MAGSGNKFSTIPASARESSPALSIPTESAAAFLSKIERLPRDSTGALVFGDGSNSVGSVLVERGRVCWAVADSMRTRLTDIMRFQHTPPTPREVIEQVYRECREIKTPLGEALVEKGIVSESGLRRALRQHSAEAIAVLSHPARPCTWHSRTATSYDPRFTFSAAELMVSLGALSDVESAQYARMRLRHACADLSYGAGFLLTRKQAVPVGAVGEEHLTVMDILLLGEWLQSFRQQESAWVEPPRVVGCYWSSGQTVVGWFEGHLSFAALCESHSSAAQIIGRVMR